MTIHKTMRMPAAIRRAVTAIAFCTLFAPALALAQDADTPPPGTLVLGPVRVVPSLTLTNMGVDNNVKNEPIDPKSDFTFTLTPRLGVLFRVRRFRASLDLLSDYVYFETYKDEGGANTNALGRLDFDLGRLQPYVSMQGIDTRARVNSEIDARARHHDAVYVAGLSLLVASRTKLLLSGTRGTVDYAPGQDNNGVDLGTSFDGRRQSVETGVGFVLTPFTSLNVTVGEERQRFVLSPDRDSDSWRVGPTLVFSPDGLVNGSASIGYKHFHALSPVLPDYSGMTAAVSVTAQIYTRHKLTANVGRDLQYSYETDTQYYIATTTGFTWTSVIAGPVDVRGTATRTLMDYSPGSLDGHGGLDTFIDYGAGLGYRVTPRARLGLDLDWSRRESDRSAVREYRNHRLFFGLTWGIKT